MSVPSVHRVPPELAAWIGALIMAAGLSLSSSLPRNGAAWAELPPGTLATAVQTLGTVLGPVAPSSTGESSAFLRPDCLVLLVPDPRELAAVLRGAYVAYPGASVSIGWAGAHPDAMRVVAVCER